MSLADLNPDHALLTIPGIGYYQRTSDGLFVTECQGKAGVREALMGSDGSTESEFPSIRYPRGFTFDGGDLITIPDNPLFSFGDGLIDSSFSVVAAIRIASRGSDTILKKSTEYEFTFGASGQLLLRCSDNSTGGSIAIRSDVNKLLEGLLYVCIGVYSGSGTAGGIKLYINAERVDSVNISSGSYTAMEASNEDIILGTDGFDGDVILPMIFDKELSADGVATLTKRYWAMYAIGPRR